MRKATFLSALWLLFFMLLYPAPAPAELNNLRLDGDAQVTLRIYDFEDNLSFLQKYHSYIENAWGGTVDFSMDVYDGDDMRRLALDIENPFYMNEHLFLNAAFTPSVELDLDVTRYRTNPEKRMLIADPLKVIGYGKGFVDVSLPTDVFEITRLRTYGALSVKEIGNILSRARVDFFNEFKDGHKQQFFGLGGGSGAPSNLRMRGMTQRVDQEVNRYGINLALTPMGSESGLTAILDFHREEFNNRAPDYLTNYNDIANANTATAITTPKQALQLNDNKENSGYVKIHHSIGDKAYISLGGRMAEVTEDNPRKDKYQVRKTALMFTTTVFITDTTNLTAYYRFHQRDNNSDFGPTHAKNLASIRDAYMQKTGTNQYGVDLVSRAIPKGHIGLGYKHIDSDRDFIYGTKAGQFIPAAVQLFNDRTQKNLFTARLTLRPNKVILLRGRFSFEDADKTHIVREASQTNSARFSATISPPNTGAYITLQYLWKDRENDQFSWVNAAGAATPQQWEFDSHDWVVSGGVSLNEKVSLFAQYTYRKQEEEANWITSDFRRWKDAAATPLVFTTLEPHLGYENKNSFGSIGASVSINPKFSVTGSYLISDSKGHLNTVKTSPSDGTTAKSWTLIDNVYQGFSGGISYRITDGVALGADFSLFDYEDDANKNMSGTILAVSSNVSMKF